MHINLQYVRKLLLRLGLVLLAYTLCRIVFYWANSDSFHHVGVGAFWGGLRFDLNSITLTNLPIIALLMLPLTLREHRWYQRTTDGLFLLINLVAIGLNLADVEYYQFTFKRSTIDLFTIISSGDDMKQLLPVFIRDYWYIVLLFLSIAYGLFSGLRNWDRTTVRQPFTFRYLGIHTLILVFIGGLAIIGARGGLQPKPLSAIDASQYTEIANAPVVLNTTFSMTRSFGKQQLTVPEYFKDENELTRYYQPLKHYHQNREMENLNVVVILLESFSQEYSGDYFDGSGHMPFLDSLSRHGLRFNNAFANGKRSIEALPAAMAALPTLMENAYISSNYGTNNINTLANLLGERGYYSAFYHGATNGSMRFDRFCQLAGFDGYFGRKEYNDDQAYDGQWGIWDEEMFQFMANDLSNRPQPFLASFFSLTSHHPFAVPARYESSFKGGDLEILRTIEYTDLSLRNFFATASEQPWYDQTLFVIIADHVGPPRTNKSHGEHGKFAIPMLFYRPDNSLAGTRDFPTQQSDIMPSVLDYLGYDAPFVAFGESVFQQDDHRAFAYLGDLYYLIEDPYLLRFNGETVESLHDYRKNPIFRKSVDLKDKMPAVAAEMEMTIKAIIQQYNSRMVQNQLRAK